MRHDIRDIAAGIVVGAAGLYVFLEAFDYGIGTARRMGPGHFPMLLGAAAMIVAAALVLPAIGRQAPLPEIAWRPLLTVLGGIGAFGLTLGRFGLIPAVLLTVLIAATGSPIARPLSTVTLAAFAALASWLLFVVGLNQPLVPLRMPF